MLKDGGCRTYKLERALQSPHDQPGRLGRHQLRPLVPMRRICVDGEVGDPVHARRLGITEVVDVVDMALEVDSMQSASAIPAVSSMSRYPRFPGPPLLQIITTVLFKSLAPDYIPNRRTKNLQSYPARPRRPSGPRVRVYRQSGSPRSQLSVASIPVPGRVALLLLARLGIRCSRI
jgi:hypothetical protein